MHGGQKHRSDNNSCSSLVSVTKRNRVESDVEPSPVVFVRNLPVSATEQEVALLAIPFGSIKNMIIVRKQNQALLELIGLNHAKDMVDYYLHYPVQLHGCSLYFTFSKYNTLDTKSQVSPSVKSAMDSANRIIDQDLPDIKSGDPNSILRVQIENVQNQKINHIILLKIFHRFGEVLRIVLYMKNDKYNCLIEFENHVQAFAALLHLNGQNIYNNCCNLLIEFSKVRGPLEVRQQSDKCRDYTKFPLNQEEMDLINDSTSSQTSVCPSSNKLDAYSPSKLNKYLESSLPPCLDNLLGISQNMRLSSQQTNLPALTAQLLILAQQHGLNITTETAAATANFMVMASLGNQPIPQNELKAAPAQLKQLSYDSQVDHGPVLMVSNLDADRTTVDGLFILFGVYGDVIRVKLLFNKRDTAFIQYRDPKMVDVALMNLHNATLFGKSMKLKPSKFKIVEIPAEEFSEGTQFTKDFTNSRLHRFRVPNSRNFNNIYPPSNTLHVSNILDDVSDQQVKEIFENAGFEILSFRFFSDSKRMAFIRLKDTDTAMQALMLLHNYQMSENVHLKITFSRDNR